MNEDRRKILIVEDEYIVAADIKMTLQKMNYYVIGISNSGEDTIRKIKIEKPDLILMDITLKGSLDGIETAQIIMTQYDIPIIYLSALNDEKTIERALSTKPSGYLFKPFDIRKLHSAIESAFVKSQVF